MVREPAAPHVPLDGGGEFTMLRDIKMPLSLKIYLLGIESLTLQFAF